MPMSCPTSIEYNMSYVYHAMSSYFQRDNVALANIALFFRASSLEELTHAQKLMNYQARCPCFIDACIHDVLGKWPGMRNWWGVEGCCHDGIWLGKQPVDAPSQSR
jgi:Ferritin-like domain